MSVEARIKALEDKPQLYLWSDKDRRIMRQEAIIEVQAKRIKELERYRGLYKGYKGAFFKACKD